MLVCNCALAGTAACYKCSRFKEAFFPDFSGWTFIQPSKKVIEEFDENGKLKKRITEG